MFHSHCGKKVKLTNGRKTAKHSGGEGGNSVVLSGEALTPGQPFHIKVEKTYNGVDRPLILGVTQANPGTRPQLPGYAKDMKRAFLVEGSSLYREGKKEGSWSGNLQVLPGDTASLMWDGADIYITHRQVTTRVFTGVTGPLWAVTQVYMSVPKLSIITPEFNAVDTKKAASVKKPSLASALTRVGTPRPTRREPPTPTPGPDLRAFTPIPETPKPTGGSLTRRRTSTITCQYWQVCNRFIDSLQLKDVFFDSQYDQCFCWDCVFSRGDNLYYTRGEPPKTYSLPGGWSRFGLSVPAKAHALDAFPKWHVAYHGTVPNNIRKILEGDLLMPGDFTLEGVQLAPPSGHFSEADKPEGFDIKQVFVSPTITYAGHAAYARPNCWTDPETSKSHDIQVALQVRIKPDSYQVGTETLGIGSKIIDAKFKNSELEWSTKIRGATIIQGILVKSLFS